MLAKDVIKENRDDLEKLNNYHRKWIESGHTHGLQCLDYDEFLKFYNMTDREIIEAALSQGVVIEDADEYLAALK